MHGARGMVIVLAMACGSKASVPDATAPPDTGQSTDPPSTIHGTAIDTRYESPSETSPTPVDLSAYMLQAYSADDGTTGFRITEGRGEANGTFSIPEVPAGPYYLLVRVPGDPVAHFYWTSSRVIDLGRTELGRRDTPPASASTTLTPQRAIR